MDFLLRAASNSIEDVNELIKKVINTPTSNDYITMTAKGFEEISPQRKYHGISAQIIAQIKNVRVPFNVDIDVGDVIVPRTEERKTNTPLPDFEAPIIMTYSLESTIAEKFDAILQRFELTGRMKDFYDIYYLARTFDFDGAKLQTSIMRTLERRGNSYDRDSFKRVVALSEHEDMQKRWKYLLKNIKNDTLEFTVVTDEIQKFLEPVFENIITEKNIIRVWGSKKLNGDLVKKMSDLLYCTDYGKYYLGKCEDTIKELGLKNKVQLILTSPPFPLNNKKQYGNLNGEEYLKWFTSLAELFSSVLTPNGSIVIEMGNAWEKNRPVQSLLHLNSLLSFVNNENAGLRLCQEFVCYNPARLPSPAQWVTINRIRTIDSFTHVWWMSNSDYPKADNRRVLRPYSKSMKKLLKSGKFNSGKRPSEHVISEKGFLTDNQGSISHNVLELEQIDEDKELRLPYSMFSISNTKSNDFFSKTCKEREIVPHPARMPLELASFFIEFLTDEGDLVLDPFGGSNTTGFCAEKLKRQWVSIEANIDYGTQSTIRFEEPSLNSNIIMEEF